MIKTVLVAMVTAAFIGIILVKAQSNLIALQFQLQQIRGD